MRRWISAGWVLVIIFMVTPVKAIGPKSVPSARLKVDTDPYSLISEVNALRAANGLPGYSINPILMLVAQQHAQFMSVAGVSHIGFGGTRPFQRGLAAGYPLAGDLTLGGFFSENITAGRNKSVQTAVMEWQGDAPHLNTMLSANLTEIGVGVVLVGDYVYYVIDCARPTSSGQPQITTALPGNPPASGGTPMAAPPIVKTLIPSTPLADGKLFHVVRPGETLWLIAISYSVKVADIRRLNNLSETQAIYPGNKLFVQLANTPTSIPPSPTNTLPATAVPPNTPTLPPTFTLVPTALPAALVPTNSSSLVLGVIVAAALVLAAVFVTAGRKK